MCTVLAVLAVACSLLMMCGCLCSFVACKTLLLSCLLKTKKKMQVYESPAGASRPRQGCGLVLAQHGTSGEKLEPNQNDVLFASTSLPFCKSPPSLYKAVIDHITMKRVPGSSSSSNNNNCNDNLNSNTLITCIKTGICFSLQQPVCKHWPRRWWNATSTLGRARTSTQQPALWWSKQHDCSTFQRCDGPVDVAAFLPSLMCLCLCLCVSVCLSVSVSGLGDCGLVFWHCRALTRFGCCCCCCCLGWLARRSPRPCIWEQMLFT